MGRDQAKMLQANVLLQLLQGNCWLRCRSSAAIIVGLQCRQGKSWNCIILHWPGGWASGPLWAVDGPQCY